MSEKLYGLRDSETVYDDIEEVIERLVEDASEVGDTHAEAVNRLAWPLEVLVFRRMDAQTLAPGIADRCRDLALETLDEELGDPDGDFTQATDAIEEAAQEFARKMCAEDEVWNCERTGEVVMVTKEQALKQGGGE